MPHIPHIQPVKQSICQQISDNDEFFRPNHNRFAKKNPDFSPIAKSLDNINDNTIKQSQKLDGGKNEC